MKIILGVMIIISIGAAAFAISKIVADNKKNSKSRVRR